MSATSSPDSSDRDLTRMLRGLDGRDPSAAEQILPLVYAELRKLAAARMANEKPGQTLQATALVHEAWLRLGGDRQEAWANRRHFFAAAAEAMRRILIENARRKRRERHGGGLERVSLDMPGLEIDAGLPDDEILLLSDALDALAAHDARKAELIKQWNFAGLTLAEIAAGLGITERTAQRDLAYAKAWLFTEMQRRR